MSRAPGLGPAAALALAALLAAPIAAALPSVAREDIRLPLVDGSLRFAVLGDAGTGKRAQYRLAEWLAAYQPPTGFGIVLMLGDNLYGSERPEDYRRKFEVPYAPLLAAGVRFHAVLGNHDEPAQRFYAPFHMQGRRYYSFVAPGHDVRFVALDSNALDLAQLRWLERTLSAADESWIVVFFHHPIYSSGKRHGPDPVLRSSLEPLLVAERVSVVLSGHEHFYERLKPQQGIQYFISGGGGKLRRDGVFHTPYRVKSYAEGLHFMLFELAGPHLYFQVVSEDGKTVDQGTITNPGRRSRFRLSEEGSAPAAP